MSFHPVRTVLFGCALALIAGTSALAKDDAVTPSETVTAPVDSKPGDEKGAVKAALKHTPCVNCPPPINLKGGTAIINFVAPVTSKTMADLAQNAQNAVIGGADAIRLNISSRGGSLHAIQFAVNVLKTLPIPVETVAMSQIASAAVALYCAGEKRYMAEGSALYLHQQRGFEEIQVKTAGAVVRELELSTQWYDDLLRSCTDADADHAMLDYSSRDLVIDVEQAATLGMVTAPISELDHSTTWGTAINVVAPDDPKGIYHYPSYR